MNDKDLLQRFIFEKAAVRGEIIHLNESFRTIINQHHYPSEISQYLGEALVAAALFSATLKASGRLTVQFRGQNELKLLIAQCDQDFHIRGLVQWEKGFPPETYLAALKEGTLAIIIDTESSPGNHYQGIVKWQGESIAHSLENYFIQSEQLPTKLWIAVNEDCAAGLFLQVLPQEKPEIYHPDWEHIITLANTITANELLTLDNEIILRRLFHEEDVRVFEGLPLTFQCTCSLTRSENAILLLSEEEINEEIKDKQKIIVTCEFCNHQYEFDKVDIARIFKKGNKPFSSQNLQ